jgi:hypothetical protein
LVAREAYRLVAIHSCAALSFYDCFCYDPVMAKMTLSRARSLIGKIVLAHLDSVPSALDTTDAAARTLIIRWLVDALNERQLSEMAALLTVDFLTWPSMLKEARERDSPEYRTDIPPTVPRIAADDGRHITARTLCQPGENGMVFSQDALTWPLPPDSDKGDGWNDLEVTREALLAYLNVVTSGLSRSTGDERRALFERIAARLFEVGTLIVAGYNAAADEIVEQLEARDKQPPSQSEDDEVPF